MKNTQNKIKYFKNLAIVFVFSLFVFLFPLGMTSFFAAHATQEKSQMTEELDSSLQDDVSRAQQNDTKDDNTNDKRADDLSSSQEVQDIEESYVDFFEQDASFYQQLSRTFSNYINLKSVQDYVKSEIIPQLSNYSKNPKYTIYSGDGSKLTLTSKVTSESRLGIILNEWVFHGSTANIVEQAKDLYDLASKLKIGQSYYVTIDINTNELLEFEYEIDNTNKIVVDFTPMLADASQHASIYKDTIKYELKLEHVIGEIHGNFSNSAIRVGENANFVNNFADVFSSDLDFSREIHNGDTFRALVEKRYRDGDFIGYGAILAAQLVNKGNTYSAYYFYESPLDDDPFAGMPPKNESAQETDVQNENANVDDNEHVLAENAEASDPIENIPEENVSQENVASDQKEHADENITEENITDENINTDENVNADEKVHTIITSIERPACAYFDAKGNARQKAFLRAPVHFTRVSSVYTMNRRHPILGVTRPHQGIDYAAPSGTPVYTVGDGVVTYVGWSGGYGKLIKVKHAGGLESQYAHLSRYASGLKKGARVLQGETIGYVGSTGLSTGPHLDFRIKKNGSFVNPDDIIIPSKAPVTPNRLELYLEKVAILDAYLSGKKPLSEYDPITWLSFPAPPL